MTTSAHPRTRFVFPTTLALMLVGAITLCTASAQSKKTLAILEFSGDKSAGVSLQERQALAENARGIAVRKLPKSGWVVMTRDNMQALLPPGINLSDCGGDECIITTGRTIQASYIVTGRFTKLGAYLQANIQLYDVATGALLGTAQPRATDVNTILDPLEKELGELFGELGGVSPPPTTKAGSAAPQAQAAVAQAEDLGSMVGVPAGCFMMGSPKGEGEILERPQHRVCLDAFRMDKTEVTQEAYKKAIGKNPSHFKGCPNCPVESVTWKEAQAYCRKQGGRLPTEAEWEYAARAGSTSEYYWGDRVDDRYAWHSGMAGFKTSPVGEKLPNAWRLHDMAGNVSEWTGDWVGPTYYQDSPERNPQGPSSGQLRALRGGSTFDGPEFLRVASRYPGVPDIRLYTFGFRCVIPKQ
jgi:formylglycine-generating enzyme required for sulfatase activity